MKIRLPEALCNLDVSVCAKIEECDAKTVEGVGLTMEAFFRFRSVANSPLMVAEIEIYT